MSLDQYSKEQLQELSLIEAAHVLLSEKKQAVSFKDLLDELAGILKLSSDEVTEKMAQFYTDLNIDGRFLVQGENHWGLRLWYPIDQTEEDVVSQVRPKKKKAKKVLDDDLDIDDYDEIDEEELDFDDVDELDDIDDLDEDEDEDDDLLEDDLDEDLEDDDLLDDEELDEDLEDEDDDLLEDDLEEEEDFDQDEDED